jgi:hypothetical protein
MAQVIETHTPTLEKLAAHERAEARPAQPPIGFVDMVDIHAAKLADTEVSKPNNRFPLRPSSAGDCDRALAYSYAEYKGYGHWPKPPMKPEMARVFSLGHSVEYDLLKHVRNVPDIQVRYQQQVLTFGRLHDGTIIEGSIDGVFVHPKWSMIMDVKSKKSKFSSWSADSWTELDEKLKRMRSVEVLTDTTYYADNLEVFLEELNDPFFASNFLQLNFYACHDFITERGINLAAIIQYSKNTSALREVRFRPSKALADNVLSRFQTIALTVDETKDPTQVSQTFAFGSIKCAFCDRKDLCWPGKNAIKEFYKSEPPKNWPKDTDRLGNDGAELETLLVELEDTLTAKSRAQQLEQKIAVICERLKVRKIRIPDGRIYEIKQLATGAAVRKGKL